VLGRGHRVALGRIHHDHPSRRRRGQVDVVDADPRAPDHAQRLGRLEQVRRHLGAAADDQSVVPGQDAAQLIGFDACAVIHLDARGGLEQRHALVGELVGDQHAKHG